MSPPVVSSAPGREHEGLAALLRRFVVARPDGATAVRYAAWADDAAARAALDDYVSGMQALTPSRLPRAEAFAYWANLYNAVTLHVVLARYPVRSIRDIRSKGAGLDPLALLGPWRTKRVTVEGRRLSLDDIEHGIMRPAFRDPRVHYAVNCASIGCPDLRAQPWRAETLDADLDAAARAYVNHPRGAALLPDGRIRLSSLYDWYRRDFGDDERGLRAHIAQYADPPLRQALLAGARFGPHRYEWALNEWKD